MNDPTDAATPTIRAVDLADGRSLAVRRAGKDDLAAVQALYGRLSVEDLRRRFFVGHRPNDRITARWLTVGERGGASLVAEVVEADGSSTIVAEAGYALLDDGDGELAITVDPAWRGWLGGWLLDILAEVAAGNGVENLQADVLVENRAMLAVLRYRGHAAVDHPDWNTVRLVVSTTGRTPGWAPRTSGQHLLVTSPGARWRGESAAQEAGFEVRTCPGPGGLVRACPVLCGRSCPLLDGADAVVFDLVAERPESEPLVRAIRNRQIPVAITRPSDGGEVPPCETVAAVIDQIVEQLGSTAATGGNRTHDGRRPSPTIDS